MARTQDFLRRRTTTEQDMLRACHGSTISRVDERMFVYPLFMALVVLLAAWSSLSCALLLQGSPRLAILPTPGRGSVRIFEIERLCELRAGPSRLCETGLAR